MEYRHRWITLVASALFALAAHTNTARAQGDLSVSLTWEEEPLRGGDPAALDDPGAPVVRNRIFWFAPSVGLDVMTYAFDDDMATVGLLPAAGVGFRYRPPEWTATDVLLAVDFYTRLMPEDLLDEYTPQGGTEPVSLEGDDYMSWDLLGVVTVFNVLAVGIGARLRFPLQEGVEFDATAILTVGIHVSTSGRTETVPGDGDPARAAPEEPEDAEEPEDPVLPDDVIVQPPAPPPAPIE